MTWFAQSPNETEAAKEHVLMFVAAAFDFASGISRYWSGIGDLTFGGFTYTGTGELGSISTPSESIRLIGETKTFRLSGVDPAIVPETDIDASFGRDVTEYFGFLNPDTHALIAAPEINWEGRMDAMRPSQLISGAAISACVSGFRKPKYSVTSRPKLASISVSGTMAGSTPERRKVLVSPMRRIDSDGVEILPSSPVPVYVKPPKVRSPMPDQ